MNEKEIIYSGKKELDNLEKKATKKNKIIQEKSDDQSKKTTIKKQQKKKKATGTITQAERDEAQKKVTFYMYISILSVISLFCIWISFFSDDDGIINEIIYACTGTFSEMSFHIMRTFKMLLYGLFFGSLIMFFIVIYREERKEYDPNTVAGSAHWITSEEEKEYNKNAIQPQLPISVTDPDWYDPNMIMGERMRRSVNMRFSGFNNNILVMGGSGAGKTRYFIKPNILNCNCSMVITDPSGEIIASVGNVLKEHGYMIKILNIHEMRYSNGYNPFEYIHDEKGIGELIDCFISNTNKNEKEGGDDFFENAERMLYAACICLLINHIEDKSLKNFGTVVKLVNLSDVDENGQNSHQSKLDNIFAQLPEDALAVKFYRAFKQGSGRTTKSIIISCLTRLQPFMYSSVHNLTQYDELELGKIGDRKTAMFIITPQAKGPYNFLSSMAYHQLFAEIYEKGERQLAEGNDSQMKYHIRCLMDEFANQGNIIPIFPSRLSTMRKYNLSASIILQDKQQIESMYPDNFLELIGNCDTKIYLGGGAPETQEWISTKLLGEATVITSSTNGVGGDQKVTKGYNKTSRSLLTPDEVDNMPPDKCIIKTRNVSPIMDTKYDYLNHPLYNYTGDADSSKKFLYRKMSMYDNMNSRHKVNLLRAEQELEEYIAEQELSNGLSISNVTYTGGELNTDEEEICISSAIQKGLEKFEPHIKESIPFAEIEHISPKMADYVLNEVSQAYGEKRPLVLLSPQNDAAATYKGYILDTEEVPVFYNGLKDSKFAIYHPQEEKEDVLQFELRKINVSHFKKELEDIYKNCMYVNSEKTVPGEDGSLFV